MLFLNLLRLYMVVEPIIWIMRAYLIVQPEFQFMQIEPSFLGLVWQLFVLAMGIKINSLFY